MTQTRTEEAQRLVDEGRVELVHVGSHVTEAFVEGTLGPYATTVYANGHFFCSCEWGQDHSYTDEWCSHALAVKLMTEKEN